jgi:hypothetical protein
MSMTVTCVCIVCALLAIIAFLTWLDGALERDRARLDQIAEDMYYEQADRDGCEYPPQWRGMR